MMKNSERPSNREPEFQPEIRRARIGKLTIYEISDAELNTLEHGTPNSILLNFSIFMLTVAISFTIALTTLNIPAGKTFTFFLSATIIGYLGGILSFFLWLRNYRSVSSVIKTIRDRLPPEGQARIPPNLEVQFEYRHTKFKLLSARYGSDEHSIDVYDKIAPMMNENELRVTSSNNIAGDPHQGVPKKLVIRYVSYGIEHAVEVPEGELITLPET